MRDVRQPCGAHQSANANASRDLGNPNAVARQVDHATLGVPFAKVEGERPTIPAVHGKCRALFGLDHRMPDA